MPVTAHRRPSVGEWFPPRETTPPQQADLPKPIPVPSTELGGAELKPDPPPLKPVAPFEPVYPPPTVGSDLAIEAYVAARGQIALLEHQGQLAMVFNFITDAVRDTLAPHKLLDALQRAHKYNAYHAVYAERTAKIARCLNVEFTAPVPPEIPGFVQFLARTDGSGLVSRDALGKKIAEAGHRVADAERAKRSAAEVFSNQTRLEEHGHGRKAEVMSLDRYFVSVIEGGGVSVAVKPASHQWAPDRAIELYDEAIVEHQRALDHQAVFRREHHKAADLVLTTAQRAIDSHGGIDGITAACVDALRISGQFYQRSTQWDEIVKRRGTIGRIESAISGLPDNSKFVASQRDDIRTLSFAVEGFIESAEMERTPQVRADVELAYNGDQDAIDSLLAIASAAPAGLFADGFVHALRLTDFHFAFHDAVKAALSTK